MDESVNFSGNEDAKTLQLHKWRSSELEVLRNLSEFREGFISPSRELLLLHSYHCEALLLPLVEDSATGKDKFLRPSELIRVESNDGFTLGTSVDSSDDCCFLSDVHSLAWGLCGEICNQREDSSFRELLFVSGRHGVTVHGFCKSHRSSETISPEDNAEQGMWMEWGPSLDDSHALGVQEDSSSCSGTVEVSFGSRTKARWQRPRPPVEVSMNELASPRRWLRTFFSEVETVKSEGYLFTRLPKRHSFPSSAKVVSFNIFSHDSTLLDLLIHGSSVLHGTKHPNLSSLDLGNNRSTVSDVSSHSFSGGTNSYYECFLVFSDNSHCLIGFALELIDPTYQNNDSLPKSRKSKVIVAIARLVSWAMQWISLVMLDESYDSVEWTDFKLSNCHLICLNSFGLISFYNAMTGEFVTSVDLLHMGGFCQCLMSLKRENSFAKHNGHNLQEEKYGLSLKPTAECTGKRRFRSLVIVSHSSLIGAIDEFGAVYVMNVDDHILGKPTKPYLHQFSHGVLAGWRVGGTDIGCQRGLSDISWVQDTLPRTSREFLSTVDPQSNNMQSIQENDLKNQRGPFKFYVSGLSSVTQVKNQQKFLGSEIPSHFMRKFFLPTDRTNEDEVICFSPFGITRLLRKYNYQKKGKYQLVHSNLLMDFTVKDDQDYPVRGWEAPIREAIGCTFQGSLYLVTEDGLSVVLPAISVLSSFLPVDAIGYRQLSSTTGAKYEADNLLGIDLTGKPWSPWKVEVLDRVLLYEGAEMADQLCLENGWELRISRIRRLQLALDYLKFDEIENSLEMLACIHLAEEGVLRLIFAAVYLMFQKVSNDNEVSAASRLLALATGFAIKTIQNYGLSQHKKDDMKRQGFGNVQAAILLEKGMNNPLGQTKRMSDMAHYLEIIRNLQLRLNVKFKRPGHRLLEADFLLSTDTETLEDDSKLPVLSADASLSDTGGHHEPLLLSEMDLRNDEDQALIPLKTLNGQAASIISERSAISAVGNKSFSVENPRDMIARWELDNLDLKTIVKDALISGRLPLAVLKLHLLRSRDLAPEEESRDTFNEIRDVGRAIAYDLFLKGETTLAITTLQKLGEDVETNLRQLLFGTLRRSLRLRIAEQMKIYGYLRPRESKILEIVSLIERIYPCSSFQNAFCARLNELKAKSHLTAMDEIELHLFHPLRGDLKIVCGDVDGVVLGLWTHVNGHSVSPEEDDDSFHAGYWTAAAVWFDAWDQITIDRVVLDQPFLMGVNVLWESQLEYHMGHNDWEEVSKLLDVIPSYAVSSGSLSVRLDSPRVASAIDCGLDNLILDNYICSVEDLDVVCFNVPNIRISRFSTNNMCSMWLRYLMEHQLAKKFVFLKEYWESTSEIVTLLARSGYMLKENCTSILDESPESTSDFTVLVTDVTISLDAVLALHKLMIHFCVQFNLPNLLDLYLDYHKLAVDQDSLALVHDAVGENEWAKWLLFLRIKGKEYEASFCNARAIASPNLTLGNNLSVLEIGDIIQTVDDIAEGAGELVALATLMYAPVPIGECLSSGSINRRCSSAQCTLENLRPALQRFPTLWRTLLAACFGQDPTCNIFTSKPKASGYSDLVDYLHWRENVFFSSGRDTSLLQMLPCWFPKAVRRLIQLYVQGPLGWQTVADLSVGEFFWSRNLDYLANSDDHSGITALSWEAAIQKHIEEELQPSSAKGAGFGIEHHLHRGRAFAAFNHLLISRVERLKMANTQRGKGTSTHGQTNVQSDVHALLSPITPSEESLLSVVVPLAIIHFEDSVLVASCAFLLELSGLPASILQIDISALRRISSFYRSSDYADYRNQLIQLSPRGSALHATLTEGGDITESLARALADYYLHNDYPSTIKRKALQNDYACKPPSRTLVIFLQHLEKASLPSYANGMTCGSWLSTGNGDGVELRSQQKSASQNWNLVTIFCQMHQISLSTKYLALLARDNDWVGFLSEAQVGGYPIETVIEVASKEFSNPRLKIHILTVLKSMQSKKKISSASNSEMTAQEFEGSISDENIYGSVELFGIIAECEKLKNPGEALLVKAKELCWSILAMIASCFPDVSPLSCLAVWLEITAARETSAIKVNDIASQIANNVGAAVEATNSLPASVRTLTFHYNRKNTKRRRLLEPTLANSSDFTSSNMSTTTENVKFEGVSSEEEREKQDDGEVKVSCNSDEVVKSLSQMVAVLCEQQLFSPLLRAFEIFLPSCSLLPFVRALQAFSQMRLSESSAHLGSFSARIKEEREGPNGIPRISSIAVKAADAMLSTCPSPYEKRCLLQLLASADFDDGGSAAMNYRRLYWKINLAEPSLRKDDCLHLGNEPLDDISLLTALVKNACWEQARNWANQLEASGGAWKSAVPHVTEMQAESMVAEWKEFLWDVPEERVALWAHCQTLFIRYSFPASQAGLFFLKHAEDAEKDLPARELHELLLLSLKWLSGMITQSNPVCPLNLLREIETRVWLLAVESESQVKRDGEPLSNILIREPGSGKGSNIIDLTANIIAKMDNHILALKTKTLEKNDLRENNQSHVKAPQGVESSFSATTGGSTKAKRRAKGFLPSRRPLLESGDKHNEPEVVASLPNFRDDLQLLEENIKFESSFSRWEERVGPEELETAILSLLEFGQVTAARQLQQKLSPDHIPYELVVSDTALKLAATSAPNIKVPVSVLDDEVQSILQSHNLLIDHCVIEPLQVLESLAATLTEGRGKGLCKRIISVVKAANMLGLSFSEAFEKQPIELLQLLTLKAQDSFEEANLLVQTHSMPPASIAQVLAESFLKGLLAAHRGGYMDSQKEEGPAPLLWRFSDFLKWAKLCPSEPEIGHALMRLVITGQEIPHACEVELLILSHHFYKSSECLDGVDVLVSLAATRVEAYVSEADFPCLARLITGVGNFHALDFILGILIENGQLDLLLQKFSAAADGSTGTAEAVRGFRMVVLTSLQQFNPDDLDAFAMVYNHFDMKHETAALLETRAERSSQQWFFRYDKDQTEDLLESMRYYIEAARVYSSLDAGNNTGKACAQASLMSLQILMPDTQWLNLSETNARRALVEQSHFQEALIVAEAYGLNQPGEWALVLWNQMLKPELTEEFVAEFVAVLPLQPSMLVELARFYRAEVAARGDQSHFSVWLTGGGLPAEWAKYLGRSFRCLLRRTRDLRLRLQLATVATGFNDVIDACNKVLDKVPENAGPLVLRKGHGGAYLPLM